MNPIKAMTGIGNQNNLISQFISFANSFNGDPNQKNTANVNGSMKK